MQLAGHGSPQRVPAGDGVLHPPAGCPHGAVTYRGELPAGEPGGQCLPPLVGAEHHRVGPRCAFHEVDQGVDRRLGLGGDEHPLAPGQGVEGDGDDAVGLARPGGAGHQRDRMVAAADHGLPLHRRERVGRLEPVVRRVFRRRTVAPVQVEPVEGRPLLQGGARPRAQ